MRSQKWEIRQHAYNLLGVGSIVENGHLHFLRCHLSHFPIIIIVKVENICEQLLLFRYNNIKIQQSAFCFYL